MDEPLSNLDASLRVNTRTEIKRLQRELDITVVFVTHDQEEAMVLSDRIAVMQRRPAAADRPADGGLSPPGQPVRRRLHRQPGHELLRGRAGARTARPPVPRRRPELALPLDACRPASLAGIGKRRRLLLGVRPTDLVVGAARELQLAGDVFLVEPVGPVSYVDVDLGGPPSRDLRPRRRRRRSATGWRSAFAAGRVRLFDNANRRPPVTPRTPGALDDAMSDAMGLAALSCATSWTC